MSINWDKRKYLLIKNLYVRGFLFTDMYALVVKVSCKSSEILNLGCLVFVICAARFSLFCEELMEIDKAIRECDDSRLKTKYTNAIYVIKRALALYS